MMARKRFNIIRQRGERQIKPSKSVVLPGVSRRIAGAEQLHQVARMIKGIGNVLFSTHSKTLNGQDQVVTLGESPVQVRTRFLLNFVQGFFCVGPCLFTSPPSRSHAPVCRSHNASACRFKTSPPVHTETFGIDPRRRVGIYARFFFHVFFFFSLPHHLHRTPNLNTTPYHTSQRPQRDRERETEREKEM